MATSLGHVFLDHVIGSSFQEFATLLIVHLVISVRLLLDNLPALKKGRAGKVI